MSAYAVASPGTIARTEDEIAAVGRMLDEHMQSLRRRLAEKTYATHVDLDPEAFPDPLPEAHIPWARAWRVGTVRFDDEDEARAIAEKYGAKCRAVRVRRVPKGTAIVREALAVLDRCLRGVPPWDDMEARRRKAQAAFRERQLQGFAAWIPDRNCPPDRVYFMDSKSFGLR